MVIGAIVCALCTLGSALSAPQIRGVKTENIEYLMPYVQPKVPDTYLCNVMKTNDTSTYLVGFKPHANMDIAHHILLYGCSEPGSDEQVWNCGEMAHTKSKYPQAPVCRTGTKILYAWAMDAPPLNLPEGVGFKVGGNTDVKYLVLQVHYKDVTPFLPPKSEKDHSGITMVTTKTPMPRRAGVYLLGTGGNIPQHSTVYMETACPFEDKITIHPFAFRSHTHGHGQVVSGYRIRHGKWTEIGRVDPHRPQMFYNATTPGLDVRKGDVLAARCTMKNELDHDVAIGSTQNDEMCNFYIMYYVEGPKIMSENYCFSPGPPAWHWTDYDRVDDMNLDGMPGDVSIIPGKKEVIKSTEARATEETIDELEARDTEEKIDELEGTIDDVVDRMSPEDLANFISYLREDGVVDEDEY